MVEPRYPSAREVAPRIVEHFTQLAAEGGSSARGSAAVPTVPDVEAMIDAAFWASLHREESYLPRISMVLVSPVDAKRPLRFAVPLPLEANRLARVAPAVERPGIHLGVWRDGNGLSVWGTTAAAPALCLVLEVSAPGLLVVKHRRVDSGKYVNVAVLEADRVKIIDDRARALPDCPALVGSLLGFDPPITWSAPHPSVMVDLAVSMREHRRGGTILIVPSASNAWRESMVHPIPYEVHPAFDGLTALMRLPVAERSTREWQDDIEDMVRVVAGLTAVDGATVVTDRYELVAFGAKISRRKGAAMVEQTSVTEPIEGGEADVVHPSRLGGTRHLSAAQFVHDQHDSLALVASQDGRFTVFAWSPAEAKVHAHRVESLLL
jgi:hypothetical protein